MNDRTLVCTTLMYPVGLPQGARLMLESARRVGIDVEVIGAGLPFDNWWVSKCVRLFEAIGDRQEFDHILFVDGEDILFLAPLDEFHEGFASYGAPFVIGGEHICWPCSWLADHPAFGSALYRYPQAGFWMATWQGFLDAFAALHAVRDPERQMDNYQTIFNCDQARFHLAIADGSLPAAIDVEQRLCHNFLRNAPLDWSEPARPRSPFTKSRPCLLHFNGTSKAEMSGAAQRLGLGVTTPESGDSAGRPVTAES